LGRARVTEIMGVWLFFVPLNGPMVFDRILTGFRACVSEAPPYKQEPYCRGGSWPFVWTGLCAQLGVRTNLEGLVAAISSYLRVGSADSYAIFAEAVSSMCGRARYLIKRCPVGGNGSVSGTGQPETLTHLRRASNCV
jgi:hypothetical protein